MTPELRYSPAGRVTSAFHDSNAFVRGLMGPIGSGKSVACCMEIVRRAFEQAPGPDGVRRSKWVVVRNCFDPETEILTETKGWVRFADLPEGERVATLVGDKLVFDTPTRYYREHFVGELMGFEGEGVNFLVTPNHKQYVSRARTRKKVWGEYEFVPTEDIYGKGGVRVRRDAEWDGVDPGFTEDQFEWFGFWFAEGHVGTTTGSDGGVRKRLIITQVKPEGVEYARDLFARAEIPFTESAGASVHFRVSTSRWHPGWGNALFELLKDSGLATTKKLPQWIKDAPAGHLKAFLKGFAMGDGSWRKDAPTYVVYTSSARLADGLQEIALKAGLVCNLAYRDRIGQQMVINGKTTAPTAIEYSLTFVTPKKHSPLLKKAWHKTQYRGWYKQEYAGPVYCVEVPSHIIYVRRNGKAFWCSNCYPELKSTTLATWTDWFKPAWFGKVKMDAPISHRLKLAADCELEVLFLALDTPDDAKKLLSLEVTGAWLNEARELPKAVLDAVTGRVGRYPSKRDGGPTWFGVIMDTNPPDDSGWWYRLAEEERPENFEFFKQPSGLSPLAENIENLPPNYYVNLLAGKPQNWIKVYVEGQYGSVPDGRPVYPEYNDNIHVSPLHLKPYTGLPLYLGIDLGLTPACTIAQVSSRGQLRVLDELVSEDMGISQFANDVLKPFLALKYPEMKIRTIIDPAGAQRAQTDERTCYDVLKKAGVHPSLAPTNSFVARREAVVHYLTRLIDGEPAFLMSPTCKRLRKAMNGDYRFKRVQLSGEDRFKDAPDKNMASHVAESLQYLCTHVVGARESGKKQTPRGDKYRPASSAGY